jgi:hypothetical protein
MDPTGLLDAVLAVAVYPGAAFLALAALVHGRLAGRSVASGVPRGPVPSTSMLPVLAAIVATAMLPLVGAPALRLPPSAGVTGNVVAVAVLLAVAVDLGAASRRVSALAAAAALPILALASAGNTVSVVAIASAQGGTSLAARITAASLLVLAASASAGGRAAAAVSAALALAAAALVIPAALHDAPPIACAGASLGVVALSGALGRLRHRWRVGVLTAAGVAGAMGGTALALLSSRA